MRHDLLPRDGLPPTDLVTVLLRLDRTRRNFEQAVIEHVSVNVRVARVPEARRVWEIREQVRHLFLRNEDAVGDPASICELVLWKRMLSDDLNTVSRVLVKRVIFDQMPDSQSGCRRHLRLGRKVQLLFRPRTRGSSRRHFPGFRQAS